MYDFSSKYICLVLTCNKPQYAKRREKHSHVYSQISKAGFEVVFLYADPTLDSFHIVNNEYYELTVPTEESYPNLAVKMKLAYTFFNTQDINGILKIDDDIYHIDEDCLDTYYYSIDYLGSFCWKLEYCDIDSNIPYKNMLRQEFFTGPFYWVSKKAIQYIVSEEVLATLFKIAGEDYYVGYSLSDKNIVLKNTHWHQMGKIKYLDSLKV